MAVTHAWRMNRGQDRLARIYRKRMPLQKSLGDQFVYVNVDTRSVYLADHNYHATRKLAAANDNG